MRAPGESGRVGLGEWAAVRADRHGQLDDERQHELAAGPADLAEQRGSAITLKDGPMFISRRSATSERPRWARKRGGW